MCYRVLFRQLHVEKKNEETTGFHGTTAFASALRSTTTGGKPEERWLSPFSQAWRGGATPDLDRHVATEAPAQTRRRHRKQAETTADLGRGRIRDSASSLTGSASLNPVRQPILDESIRTLRYESV